MTNKPRPHADIIKAWADGAEVQYRAPDSTGWVDSPDPAFVADYEYRVKPAREYVRTSLTAKDLAKAYTESRDGWEEGYISVANAALRHAIDAGQVVTREEFNRAIGNRDARDMAVANAAIGACAIAMPNLSYYAFDLAAIIAKVKA